MAGDDRLDGLAEFAQEVEAIDHLDHRRRPAGGAIGEDATAVAASDPHPLVLAQPSDDGLGRLLRQQVDWLVRFQTDQQTAAGPAALESHEDGKPYTARNRYQYTSSS